VENAGTTPSNLPEQFTSLVGRERELAAVADALGRSRLLVLTGAGGAGRAAVARRPVTFAAGRTASVRIWGVGTHLVAFDFR
jgi:hypothetical protein